MDDFDSMNRRHYRSVRFLDYGQAYLSRKCPSRKAPWQLPWSRWVSNAWIKNIRYSAKTINIDYYLSSSALSWRLSVATKAAAALENSWWCSCWCCSWPRCSWPWCRCCFLCCLWWPGCWWPWWPRALGRLFPWKKRSWKLRCPLGSSSVGHTWGPGLFMH